MRKIYSVFILVFFAVNISYAQILTVEEVEQEQTEWCWVGVSKCIVDYYGDTTEQCEIAEYTRNTATWHSFGNTDCCNNPNQGCNYWNYNYGHTGSIKDILIFFAGVNNYGQSSPITEPQIDTELSNGRPFVIRWGWYSGGGHFVVGYGKSGNTIYYMNPWFGEGKKLADYNWVVDDGNHQWTHTNVLTTTPSSISLNKNYRNDIISISPNPSNGNIYLHIDSPIYNHINISIMNINGKLVFQRSMESILQDFSLSLELNSGMYFMKITGENTDFIKKFIIY